MTSLACYLHSYHAKNIVDWFSPVFQQKVGFCCELKYIYLSYHIEIKPKRPTTETSRIGTPPKFIQAEKTRPKRPNFCYLHSYHAEIIWIGLLSHSSAKNVFIFYLFIFFARANLRKIGSSPHYTRFETGHNWVSGKCFAYMIRTFPKIIGFFTFKLE